MSERGCLVGVWQVSERCLEDALRVSGRSSHDRSSQDWSSQDRSSRRGQVRTGQDWTGHVRTGQVRTGQVRKERTALVDHCAWI